MARRRPGLRGRRFLGGTRGAAMTVTPPFTDTSTVIALAAEHGPCQQPSPFALTVTVQCPLIDLFARRLSNLGCAGLRVTVRTPRPVTGPTVHHLARARIS